MARKIDDDLLLKLKSENIEQKEIAKRFNVSPAAVSKRLKRLEEIETPESFKSLTDKQKKFALSIAEGKTQTQSALSSFECGSMDSAKSLGCKLMKDPDINLAVSDLLAQEGLSKRDRAQRLKNHMDGRDPAASLKAIDIVNRIDGSYGPPLVVNVDIKSLHADIKDLDEQDRELQREIDKLEGKTVKDEVIDVKPDFAPERSN